MKLKTTITWIAVFIGLLFAFHLSAAPHDVTAMVGAAGSSDSLGWLAGMAMAGTVGDMDKVMSLLDGIETKMAKFAEKAELEAKAGTISAETKSAIESLGSKQKELADEILILKQRNVADADETASAKAPGDLFVKSDGYGDHVRRMLH